MKKRIENKKLLDSHGTTSASGRVCTGRRSHLNWLDFLIHRVPVWDVHSFSPVPPIHNASSGTQQVKHTHTHTCSHTHLHSRHPFSLY